MRGAVLYGPRDVRFEEREAPKIVEPTDAIIRISATCVCGSDLWPYRGIDGSSEPTPMGHEYCGIVEEVGGAVRSVKPGRFVIGSFFASDNTCPDCQVGYQSSCRHKEFVGGALALLGLRQTVAVATPHFAAVPFILKGARLLSTVPRRRRRPAEPRSARAPTPNISIGVEQRLAGVNPRPPVGGRSTSRYPLFQCSVQAGARASALKWRQQAGGRPGHGSSGSARAAASGAAASSAAALATTTTSSPRAPRPRPRCSRRWAAFTASPMAV
jgi:hypothetical protein